LCTRIIEPCGARSGERDLDGATETGQTGSPEPLLHGGEQFCDLRLRGVGPRRLGDQVDLAPVGPMRHDLRAEAAAAKLSDRRCGRRVESRLLIRRRLAAVEQLDPIGIDPVDLGAAVDAEVEPPRPSRPGAELAVDDADLRIGNHDEIEP